MNTWHSHEDYQEKLDALIRSLRQEANEAKGCFTTFSFQGIALGSAILGIIFNGIKNNSLSSLAIIPLVSLLMVVSRIGVYKYSAANRAYGLQAYIERTEPLYRSKKLKDYEKTAFENLFKNADWERLFMVWRMVMPSIISEIYRFPKDGSFIDLISPFMYKHTAKYKFRVNKSYSKQNQEGLEEVRSYTWFKLRELTNDKYRPGTYLKNMMLVLTIMQLLYLLALCVAIFHDIVNSLRIKEVKVAYEQGLFHLALEIISNNSSAIILITTLIIMGFLVFSRKIRTTRRRILLESGILSIHSCAIVWRLTVIAHDRALRRAADYLSLNDRVEVDAYTFDRKYLDYLQDEVDGIRKNAIDPSKWLESF